MLPVGEEVARLTRGAEGEAAEALAARLGPPLEQACEQACAALAGCVVSALPSLSEQRRQLLQERLLEVAMEALHHGLAPALASSERAAARTSEPAAQISISAAQISISAAQISISADSGGGADPATAPHPTNPAHPPHPPHPSGQASRVRWRCRGALRRWPTRRSCSRCSISSAARSARRETAISHHLPPPPAISRHLLPSPTIARHRPRPPVTSRHLPESPEVSRHLPGHGRAAGGHLLRPLVLRRLLRRDGACHRAQLPQL